MDRSLRLLITAAVMGGIFVAALDTTVVASAMPVITSDLGHRDLYSWPFAIYMVASTATVPLYGRLADSSGRKPLYLLAVGLFLLGSVLCGLATTMPFLIGARLVQGLGAGGMLPLALTVAGDVYEPEARPRIMGLFSSVWAVASIIGPIVGGGIVQTIGWRWIFLLNVPIGIASAALLHRCYTDVRSDEAPGRPDFAGAVALTLGLGLLCFALYEVSFEAWLPAAGAAATAGLLGWFFVRMERRAEDPLVDTGLLRIRIVAASNAVGFLSGGLLFTIAMYVPLWVQDVEGGTATASGLPLTAMSIAWFTGALVVGRLIPLLGYRLPVAVGVAMLTAGAAFLVALRPGSSALALFLPMAGAGLGLGFSWTATLVAVQNAVERHRLGQATSSVHLFRSVGAVFGVSLAGCVQVAANRATGDLARSLTLSFGACLAFAAMALVAALFIPPGRRP